jgi:hypothetical protein
MANRETLREEGWEDFDAVGLFPPPRLHTDKLTKLNKRDLNKVEQDEFGEQDPSSSQEQEEPQDGDSYTDAPQEKGHEDELFEMDGLEGGAVDDREVKIDKEEDRRTEEPEPEAESEDEAEGKEENQSSDGQEASEAEEQSETEGVEKPEQKESEDVDEVGEATSETSEDVHGGSEATKDIEDSPNAADDGQNPDNEGAEAGEDGEEGEGSDGNGQEPSDSQSGSGQGDVSQEDAEADEQSEAEGSPMAQEDWEAKADHSAQHLALENSLEELEAKARDEKGHRTSMPSYQFDRKESPVELEIAFQKGRELILKLAAEEDFTRRVSGQQRWDAKTLLRDVVSYRHPRIPSDRYDRPREADIVMLLDISGSCAQQAEMFMAIAAGAVGQGVRIYVGYNGSARAAAMEPPKRLPRSYDQAKAWVQQEINRVSGWDNARTIGEWSFRQFVEEVKPKTLIIFGDWDGINQYQRVVKDPKVRSTRFFWFANEGGCGYHTETPEKWTRKSYFPGVYTPRDLVKALRKIR